VSKADLNGRRSPESPDAQSPDDGAGSNGGLTRVTVNLTPRSIGALDRASRATGDTKTDTINRALQVYALVQELVERGGGSLKVTHEDGETERIYLL
jgi:hypothetical protein